MEEIVLTKQSGSEELKRYFTAVLELSKQDNRFPINLDEVWMLAYKEKGKAVRALKKNFIEGEDFTSFAQNGKRDIGGTQTIVYQLSVSCMEYFIARKVRPVFEVYRKVFHKVADAPIALPSAKELALMVVRAEEEKERLALENKEKQAQLEQKEEVIAEQTAQIKQAAPKVDYYNKYLTAQGLQSANQIGMTLGVSGKWLNDKLRQLGVQYKQSGLWILKSPFKGWNLATTKPWNYTDPNTGEEKSRPHLYWNNRGVRFIMALKECNWSVKLAVKALQSESVTLQTN